MTYRFAFPVVALLWRAGVSAKDAAAPMSQTKSLQSVLRGIVPER
jgi:hypothetical protein